jgi:hypothetical protein
MDQAAAASAQAMRRLSLLLGALLGLGAALARLAQEGAK